MAITTLTAVEDYLHTTYRPDCDYLDGEVLERNMGEIPHSRLQRFFLMLFVQNEATWHLDALPEQRLQISPTRFRIPDVLVLHFGYTDTLIVQSTPLLCIEVFSSEDRMSRMRERVADYQSIGVPTVWAVDPWRRMAYIGAEGGRLVPEETALVLPGTPISVDIETVFAELDRHPKSPTENLE